MALIAKGLRAWVETGLDLLFPWPKSQEAEPEAIVEPFCEKCGLPFPSLEGQPSFVCSTCASQAWHFDWARSGYRMEGQVRESIIGFKYSDQFYRRNQLVEWLAHVFDRYASQARWDGLVPVPLHHLRQRERGFNQAAELADGLGERSGIRTLSCLYRCRETASQARLARKARLENLKGAFQLKRGFDLKNLNLLLIDDVLTTGATAHACAQALRSGGAGKIAVLTVARS